MIMSFESNARAMVKHNIIPTQLCLQTKDHK